MFRGSSSPEFQGSPGRPQVRPARAGDEAVIRALLQETRALHLKLQPAFLQTTPSESREWMPRSDDEALLVAEDGAGEVRGLACLHVYAPQRPSLAPHGVRAYLDELIVMDGYRRQGLGRMLILESERWARERGAQQLLFTVWGGNTAAEHFYQSLGYGRISQVLGRTL